MEPKNPYVASSKPVNRRTAARPKPRAAAMSPLVRERMAMVKTNGRLGRPLAEQLRSVLSNTKRAPLGRSSLVGAVLVASALMVGMLAIIQRSLATAAAALPLLAVGGVALMIGQRARSHHSAHLPKAATLFDSESISAFDKSLERFTPESTDQAVTLLKAIKDELQQMARMTNSAATNEYFTLDDRMYATECIRRYLPDSLHGYLRIPAEQRSVALNSAEQNANELLNAQLTLMLDRLRVIRQKLVQSASDNLIGQQQFLEAKNRL